MRLPHRQCCGTGRSTLKTGYLSKVWPKPGPPAPHLPITRITTTRGWVAVRWKSPKPGETQQALGSDWRWGEHGESFKAVQQTRVRQVHWAAVEVMIAAVTAQPGNPTGL